MSIPATPGIRALAVKSWTDWLTDERLSRWNHLRHRAGLEPVTREQGADLLSKLDGVDGVIESIKWRIGE